MAPMIREMENKGCHTWQSWQPKTVCTLELGNTVVAVCQLPISFTDQLKALVVSDKPVSV